EDEPVELGAVADLGPTGVVDVLFAPGIVPSCHLNVPILVGADPDVGPGRWNGKPFKASTQVLIPNVAALWIQVGKAAPPAFALEARFVIVHMTRARQLGRAPKIVRGSGGWLGGSIIGFRLHHEIHTFCAYGFKTIIEGDQGRYKYIFL